MMPLPFSHWLGEADRPQLLSTRTLVSHDASPFLALARSPLHTPILQRDEITASVEGGALGECSMCCVGHSVYLIGGLIMASSLKTKTTYIQDSKNSSGPNLAQISNWPICQMG